jgi:hypothetical protein
LKNPIFCVVAVPILVPVGDEVSRGGVEVAVYGQCATGEWGKRRIIREPNLQGGGVSLQRGEAAGGAVEH